MPHLAKHAFAFCLAILVAGVGLNAVTTVPPPAGVQPVAIMAAPELA